MLEIREYIDELGRSRYADWVSQLDDSTQARITIALRRVGTGNLSNVKSVGSGVFELRLNFGPGFRVFWEGKEISWFFFSVAAPSVVRKLTSNVPRPLGGLTNGVRKQENSNATHA